MGLIYQSKGDFSLAQEYFQKSIAAREQLGDELGAATAKLNLGLVLQLKGEWDLAKSYFDDAALTFENLGDVSGFAAAQNNLGNLHSDRGDSLQAILCYNLSLEARNAENDTHGIATTLGNLARVYSRSGQRERLGRCTARAWRASESWETPEVREDRCSAWESSWPKKADLEGAMQHFRDCLLLEIEREDSCAMIEVPGTTGQCKLATRTVAGGGSRSMLRFADALRSNGDSRSVASVLCSYGNLRRSWPVG